MYGRLVIIKLKASYLAVLYQLRKSPPSASIKSHLWSAQQILCTPLTTQTCQVWKLCYDSDRHTTMGHVGLLTGRDGGFYMKYSLELFARFTDLSNSLHVSVKFILKSVMVVNHWVSILKYCGSQPSPRKTAEILLFACTLTHIFFISKQEISHRVGSQGVISEENTKETHNVQYMLSAA